MIEIRPHAHSGSPLLACATWGLALALLACGSHVFARGNIATEVTGLSSRMRADVTRAFATQSNANAVQGTPSYMTNQKFNAMPNFPNAKLYTKSGEAAKKADAAVGPNSLQLNNASKYLGPSLQDSPTEQPYAGKSNAGNAYKGNGDDGSVSPGSTATGGSSSSPKDVPDGNSGALADRSDLTAAQGGLGAMIVPGMKASGVLRAQIGKAATASGNAFTLDLYGDQLVRLVVSEKVMTRLTDVRGAPLTSHLNSAAAKTGVEVFITPTTAKTALDNVINVSKVGELKGFQRQGNRIVLLGMSESKPAIAPNAIGLASSTPSKVGGVRVTKPAVSKSVFVLNSAKIGRSTRPVSQTTFDVMRGLSSNDYTAALAASRFGMRSSSNPGVPRSLSFPAFSGPEHKIGLLSQGFGSSEFAGVTTVSTQGLLSDPTPGPDLPGLLAEPMPGPESHLPAAVREPMPVAKSNLPAPGSTAAANDSSSPAPGSASPSSPPITEVEMSPDAGLRIAEIGPGDVAYRGMTDDKDSDRSDNSALEFNWLTTGTARHADLGRSSADAGAAADVFSKSNQVGTTAAKLNAANRMRRP